MALTSSALFCASSIVTATHSDFFSDSLRVSSSIKSLGRRSNEFFLIAKPFCPQRRPFKRRLSCILAAATPDYYQVLGLSKSATRQEIKASYRKLALEFHPDVNKAPEAEERFKEIAAAYDVLSNDEKRQAYDEHGAEADGPYYTENPFDFFESVFTRFGREPDGWVDSGGADTSYELCLDLKEAVFGVEKTLDVVCWESCSSCNATGSKSKRRKKCRVCGGVGEVLKSYGFFEQAAPCSNCDGQGEVVVDQCRKCGGKGLIRAKKSITIEVPCGVDNGSTLRVPGAGDAGKRGSRAGDLYVNLKIRGMPGIRRDGVHLFSEISVNYTDCILGTTIKVRTLEGYSDLRIPEGTQPGDTLVLRKLGVPIVNKPWQRGNHTFVVKATLPKKISEAEKELVRELARLGKGHSRTRKTSKSAS